MKSARAIAVAVAVAALASCGGGGPAVPGFLRAVSPKGSNVLFTRTGGGGLFVGAELLVDRCTQVLTVGVARGGSHDTYTDDWYDVPSSAPVTIVDWEGLQDVVVLRATSAVTSVTWRVDGAVVDDMRPHHGWAVLVGPRLPETTRFLTATEGEVVAVDAGRPLPAVSVDDADVHPPAVPDAVSSTPPACARS